MEALRFVCSARVEFRKNRGFTLIEMLVSVVVFSLVVLAVYGLFDQGRWYYLHSEKRSNIQDIARIAMESLEREIRMAGSGVPAQGQNGGATYWTPFVFQADTSAIGFRADIDSRNTMVKANLGGTLDVWDAKALLEGPYSPAPSGPAVLVKSMRIWEPLTITYSDEDTVSASPSATLSPVEELEVYTPEHIFYQLNGDADDDGNCDNVGLNDYPFCTLQRVEVAGNTPITTTTAAFADIATNIIELTFEYMELDGDAAVTNYAIQLIRVHLIARDRARKAGEWQDVELTSEIMVRDARY